MKKIFSIIFFVCLFLLTSCNTSNKGSITVAEAGYSCNADVSFGENFSVNTTLYAIGGGLFSVKINTPKEIEGLTFSFDNGNMNISLNQEHYSGDIPLEYGGFSKILNEIFLKFTTSRPEISLSNGEYSYSGSNSHYDFTVIFNEQGFPLRLIVDEEDLFVEFSDWKY